MNKKIKVLLVIISLFLFKQVFAADLKNNVSDKFYSSLNEFSQNLAKGLSETLSQNENIKYFDISVDIKEKQKPSFEIQSVNRISEDSDSAIFNQANIISHDGDTTINLGIGKRKLLNNDTLMLGGNFFLDRAIGSEAHFRSGLGVEAISSVLDLRGNYYNAISGWEFTDEGKEKALDGYDLQLNYHVKGSTNTDLFIQTFEWENPNSTYKEKGEKAGITSKVGYFAFEAGYLNNNKNNDGFFGSIKLVIPLGEEKENSNVKNTETNSKYASVRDKLYIPVKRENKIRVVKIASGVQVSGF